jgi:hypothetical protein
VLASAAPLQHRKIKDDATIGVKALNYNDLTCAQENERVYNVYGLS